jgi:hypothetical protein
MVEVEGIPPPMLKPKLAPPLEKIQRWASKIDGMGVEMLGILMDGNDDTTNIPQIEGPIENGMDGVGPMELRGGNVDITGMPLGDFPLVPLDDGIIGFNYTR